MKTALALNDKRKFSGQRVLAKCDIALPIFDPFSIANNLKTGYLVFNMRGGCIYLQEHIHAGNLRKIFPEGDGVTLKQLVVTSADGIDFVLSNLKIKFLRLKELEDREGIVFRFVDLTEEQVDILFHAQERMPEIGGREESAVPFDEVLTLDRDHFETSGGFGNLSLVEID